MNEQKLHAATIAVGTPLVTFGRFGWSDGGTMRMAVRFGGPDDVEDAVSVYERSNLARRRGVWPSRALRVTAVTARLRDDDTWFPIGRL
ncbi:MAG TPA: hypothetical protein VH701_17185 [Vicinamibacterales bacterium]